MKSLRELANSHPYYMSVTNYLADGSMNYGQTHYDNVADFLDEWGESDNDYNSVFRWDIHMNRDDEDEFTGTFSMQIAVILQRKGHLMIQFIDDLDEESLPAIMAWLQERYDYVKRTWKPLL